eukprot:Platyproteum_vivax@DN6269_c0_g1_i1.p1
MGQVLDKRTARKEYKTEFCKAIDEVRANIYNSPVPTSGCTKDSSDITVAIRKRPIFDKELHNGEFDVLTCHGNTITVHDCRMHPDMKKMFMNNALYPFDFVFDETMDSNFVYKSMIEPLVANFLQKSSSSVLMYGQTGSGKTFTMSTIQKLATKRLFENREEGLPHWRVTAYEVAGKGVYDLLQPGNPELQLREDAQSRVQVCGVNTVPVCSPEELYSLFQQIAAARQTQSTLQNDRSSRTHAVVRIHPYEEENRPNQKKEIPCLTLVDLAGSERNADSTNHDAERRKECAQINSSLMNLKECIRQRALMRQGYDNVRIPYRQAKLTQVLKDTFSPNCKTGVISCVCPTATSTEHSVNTIEHSCLMKLTDSSGGSLERSPSETPSNTSNTSAGKKI